MSSGPATTQTLGLHAPSPTHSARQSNEFEHTHEATSGQRINRIAEKRRPRSLADTWRQRGKETSNLGNNNGRVRVILAKNPEHEAGFFPAGALRTPQEGGVLWGRPSRGCGESGVVRMQALMITTLAKTTTRLSTATLTEHRSQK